MVCFSTNAYLRHVCLLQSGGRKEATRGLTNAQHFFIAEAGHGALAYRDCVKDMTAAFIDNPARKLGDQCVKETAVQPFYIAPWVKAEKAE